MKIPLGNRMMGALDKIIARVNAYYQLLVNRDPQRVAQYRWVKARGDSTLRLDYPLSRESIVFDVGGYKGDWAAEIVERYDPYVYVFEPVPSLYSDILNRFEQNPKVSVFSFGLLDETKTDMMSLCDNSSSLFRETDNMVEIELVDIHGFLARRDIEEIDLIKINIEGGEYDLLKRMLETDIVQRCYDIQVQFHDFFPNAATLRDEIRASLQCTHFLTYDYYFVWENWRRK